MKFAFPKRRMPFIWRLLTIFGWSVTGCVSVACLLLIWGVGQVSEKLLEPKPWSPPPAEMPEHFLEELQSRIEVEEDERGRRLVLAGDAEDLRRFVIQAFPQTGIHVMPSADRLIVQLSHPTPDHRYLNLRARGKIEIAGGRLVTLELDEVQIGGISIPPLCLPALSNFLAGRVTTFMERRRQREEGVVLRDFSIEGDRFHFTFDTLS
ncbi:MAG: hypothetical protein D6812_18100 [Deltaproteobacteria bacterium]|nr:MAG: hypothetical protein D6812_18100 [Deltaproteobacteria bacterium]